MVESDLQGSEAKEAAMAAEVRALRRELAWSRERIDRLMRERDRGYFQLRAVIEQMPAAVWIADVPSGRIGIGNEYSRRIMAQPEDPARTLDEYAEYVGFDSSGKRLAGEDWPLARAVAKGETVAGEIIEFQTPDGERRYARFDAAPIHDANGDTFAAVVVGTDITELKSSEVAASQAAEALKRSEERMRLLADAQPTLISYLDREYRYRYVNQAYVDWFGHEKSDFEGHTFADALGEAAFEVAKPALDQALAGKRHRFETWMPYKDGGQKYINVSYMPDIAPDGQVAGVYVSVADLTGPKLAEAARIESEQRFRAIADNIPQLAWMADESGSISWYNRRWYEYTGTILAEMEGWGWRAVHHPEHAERVESRFRDSIAKGIAWEDTFPLKGKDGRYRWFLSRALPIRDKEGRIERWFGTNTDVTEKIEAEKILERKVQDRTKELTEVNSELESFSYSVSHDLRAPLRSVSGFSKRVRKLYGDKLDDQGKDYLDRIAAAATRMGRLIDDLLNLSRVGRTAMSVGEVDLTRLAESVIEDLRESDPKREVQWRVQSGVTGEGDPSLLRIVLQNLLGNSWVYTSRTEKPCIEFGAKDEGGVQTYFVKDNGAGFEMEYAGKLFGAFQRLHPDSEFEGTGIGLATVRRILSRHGGRAWGVGEVGKGATFFFQLQPQGENHG